MKKVIGWILLALALGNIIWWIVFPPDFSVVSGVFATLCLLGWYRWSLRPLRER